MLAVTGGKGGVGKTTTALGVARALGRREEAVVAVDVDRDLPDLARTARVDTVRSSADALDSTPGQADPVCSAVRIVTAPRSRRDTRRLLEALADRPEFVVLDCPAGAGRSATAPLRFAERSLVVSTVEPASLRDAAKTVAVARALDARPVAAVLSGCNDRPTAVERLLPTPVLPVPRVCEPLEADRLRDLYEELSYFATLRNC